MVGKIDKFYLPLIEFDGFNVKVKVNNIVEKYQLTNRKALELAEYMLLTVKMELESRLHMHKMLLKKLNYDIDKILSEVTKEKYIGTDEDEALDGFKEHMKVISEKVDSLESSIAVTEIEIKSLEELVAKCLVAIEVIEKLISEL